MPVRKESVKQEIKNKETKHKCTCQQPLHIARGKPEEIPIKIAKLSDNSNDKCMEHQHMMEEAFQRMHSMHSTISIGGFSDQKLSTQKVASLQKFAPSFDAFELEGPYNTGEHHGKQYGKSTSTIYGLTLEPLKVYKLGEIGSATRPTGPLQDFYSLRQFHLNNKSLFEDPDNSLLFDSNGTQEEYEWKRPRDLVTSPKFFTDNSTRFNIPRDMQRDCRLAETFDSLVGHNTIFSLVVPKDQCFGKHYAGIFHFRLWYFGRWIDVVVDDRLPTRHGKLVHMLPTVENEFWGPLLQKAYFKLHGCREIPSDEPAHERLVDFTGGITQVYNMNDEDAVKIIRNGYGRASLIRCSTEPDLNMEKMHNSDGFASGRFFSVTKIIEKTIETESETRTELLLRLRNPWGRDEFQDSRDSDYGSSEHIVFPKLKTNDGEFWITFEEFSKRFDRLEVCNLNPDMPLVDEKTDCSNLVWQMSTFEGEWVAGVTAGGSTEEPQDLCHNPQYQIILTESDEDDADGKCTLVVSLIQKPKRRRQSGQVAWLNIGFLIYHVRNPDDQPKPLDYHFFQNNNPVEQSPAISNRREVTGTYKVPPGAYCIVPHALTQHEEGRFLLRVFSEHANDMSENDQEVDFAKIDVPLLEAQQEARDQEEADGLSVMFQKLSGTSGKLNWYRLKEILDKTAHRTATFSKDVCRSMITMVDQNRTGRLTYDEFLKLWSAIAHWRKVFASFDTDRSGTICGFGLRAAMRAAGYSLSSRILNLLVHRYGNQNNMMEFEDFMLCTIKLTTMMNLFTDKKDDKGYINLRLEEWLECTLYS